MDFQYPNTTRQERNASHGTRFVELYLRKFLYFLEF